jgi:hypothetical protein
MSKHVLPNRLGAVVITMILLAPCWLGIAYGAADAGEVLTFNGDCAVVADGKRTVLKVGDTIHVGDSLEVPDDGKLKLRMVDGSVLALGHGTKMTVQVYEVDAANRRNAKLKVDTGLLRAVVSKVGDQSTFEVDSATGVAAVRSTDWFFETQLGRSVVTVIDGGVSFTPLGKATVLVPANSMSEVDRMRTIPRTASGLRPVSLSGIKALLDRTNVRYGWCHCISNHNVVQAGCQASINGCKADCTGGSYSYVPNALQSCSRFDAELLQRGKR